MFEKFGLARKAPENKGSFGGSTEEGDAKKRYGAPRRSADAPKVYPVLSESFLADKDKLIQEVKRKQMEELNKSKKNSGGQLEHKAEQPLSELEIALAVTEYINSHLDEDEKCHYSQEDYDYNHWINRDWPFRYKDLKVEIRRKEEGNDLMYEAHRYSDVDEMSWTDSDEARHKISERDSHNMRVVGLKDDIERGVRNSKKDKKEYIELLLESKAIDESELVDRSDKKSLENAVNNIFKRLDEIAAL